jgi:hypothetical protein
VFALFTAALLLRVAVALRPGLWVDEIFSLAMATGHSLEHPAAEADRVRGDFIEPVGPQPADAFIPYVEHESPPAKPGRVIRAVFLSDTSPPLYYLLLSAWTRVAGTSDAALRMLSVLFAAAALPLLWLVGRRTIGRTAAWIACVLFSFAPAAVYYSAEGRMYALLWLLGLALAWLTLLVARRGARPVLLLAWSAAGAAGLLTHYFFAFVWAACLVWLALHPGRSRRTSPLLAGALTLLLVLPWYRHVPASLARWRISAGWLEVPLTAAEALLAPIRLTWSMLSGQGHWGGWRLTDAVAALLYLLAAVLVLRRGVRPLFTPRRQLIWIWFAGSVLGVIALDLARGTSAALVTRYALPGLPAVVLLAGLVIARLPRRWPFVVVAAICLLWLPGIRDMFRRPSRPWQPFPELAAHLRTNLGPSDPIVIHSIPSGVLGVTRYLQADNPVVSWVVRLHRERAADQLEPVLSAACRVALVKVHFLGDPSPAEEWLDRNAVRVGQKTWHRTAQILYYRIPHSPADKSPRNCPETSIPAASARESRERPGPHSGG